MLPVILSVVKQIRNAVGDLDTGNLARILQISVDISPTSTIWGDSSDGVGPATTGTLPASLVQYSSWTINAGNTITCAASPQVIKVNGTLTVNGTLQATQTGSGRLLLHYADASGAKAIGGLGGTTASVFPGTGGGVAALPAAMFQDCPSDYLFGTYLEGGKGGTGDSNTGASSTSFDGETGIGSGGGGGARAAAGATATYAGGPGGGAMIIIAKSVVIGAAGSIQSIGAGGASSAQSGGGGGGGGTLIVISNAITVTPGGQFISQGGVGGTGTGAGGAGGLTTTQNGAAVAGATGSGSSGGGGSSGLIITRII